MHRQGDILLVPLPFTDLSAQKKRPVLVLSKDGYNNVADDLIVAAITSNVDEKQKPYSVLLTNDNMADGKLKMDSLIRADKIYTLSQDIVVKRYGKVGVEIIERVKEKMLALIDSGTTS
ncbi:MAG: type II toxin-antitoxin system PemK/MazF family toxin [Defluviitaleaceae bacterium]|nr:type II toxin-antitoxin system PemK/MazF family toxin [Defluviitaleaceae bacterium]